MNGLSPCKEADDPPRQLTAEEEQEQKLFFRHLLDLAEQSPERMNGEFFAGAIHGYALRGHVDVAHVGEEEKAYEISLTAENLAEGSPRRDGFTVGYRWREQRTAAP